MGRRLILIVLSGGLALGLLHWSERPGHTLPKWVLLLAALPLLLLSAANDDDGDDGDDDSALGRFLSGFGKFYFGVGGMALIVVGFVGLSLGADGVGPLLAIALPGGVILLFIAVMHLWLDSR